MRIETKAKLNYLAETKSLIKSALNEKGIAIADSDTFRSYADSIRNTEFQSPDVRYVTFMNGEETLYVKPVATGDDCVNVLTKGLITTPKKESTVDKVFTYAGWAATDGGAVNANVLKAVTEDKTVYAAYTESVRYYTIYFYDGDTLIKSQQVAYGSLPVIVAPTKDGYSFTDWEPSLAPVTGDANYYAQWKEKTTFAGGSWADIAAISEAGEAEQYFTIGDTRTEPLTYNGITYNTIWRIAGFNHDTLSDGSGKAGMTLVCHTLIEATKRNYSTAKSTFMAHGVQSLIDALRNGLSTEFQSVLKEVTKEYNVVTKPANVTGTATVSSSAKAMKAFPITPKEAGSTKGKTSYDSQDLGECYSLYSTYALNYYYKNINLTYNESGVETRGLVVTRTTNENNGYLVSHASGSSSEVSTNLYAIFAVCV